jgi:RNA polymerase sigma-70 factor (ECF subfamily)
VTDRFSDPSFLARLRAKDPEALGEVVKAYLGQIQRAARGAGLTASEADDVAQATCTTFIETADRFEGRSHVRTWLFGILYKTIAGRRRERDKERRVDDIDETFETRFDSSGSWSNPPRGGYEVVWSQQVADKTAECLDEAPDKQRMAFVLREVHGLSSEEICNALEVSRTNLGVMLHRLRHRLRDCLESKGVWGGS